MLKLTLRFESSWSNCFFESDARTPLFTSRSSLVAHVANLIPVPFPEPEAGLENSSLSYLRALQKANPELRYRVPDSFENTIKGVLARLVGEPRRLRDIQEQEPNHIALRAAAAGTAIVHIEQESSYTTTLTSYTPNPVQSRGQGLLKPSPLWEHTDLAKYLFGHLGMSVHEMDKQAASDPVMLVGSWTPGSPAELLDRLQVLKAEQPDHKGKPALPTGELPAWLGRELPDAAEYTLNKRKEERVTKANDNIPTTIAEGALNSWNYAGAIIVLRIRQLPEALREDLIQQGVLTKTGLPGLAMSGDLGNTTAKDMFKKASGSEATSTRLPFTINIKMKPTNPNAPKARNEATPTGVLKKDGYFTLMINDNPTLEDELEAAIIAASVGPLHFGKKGVAYLQSLERQ